MQAALEEARSQTGRAKSDLISTRSRNSVTQSRLDALGVELERIKAERAALERVLTSARTTMATGTGSICTAAGVEGASDVDGSGEQQPLDSARTDDSVPPLPLDTLPLRASMQRSEDEWQQMNTRLKVCLAL